jgi:hypothetical protein
VIDEAASARAGKDKKVTSRLFFVKLNMQKSAVLTGVFACLKKKSLHYYIAGGGLFFG